ncbi:MAG: methylenetetrahydrofolate reductase [Calditrichaceae bacterium]|nr:methylenetetrahydrofolate reductase [Calditrichaceae bacterium]RQV95341.1 MAG: methylenetetrahydrofolate reductase [Calditrichota bacterium]
MTLKDKIASDRFIVCAEIGPPQSCDGDVIREKSKHFKGYVDAVNITDNQTAVVRLSSIASAKILLDEGLEPIMQMTCRDRNRLAIQSDLLGAAALGIHNVLCLTGDYPTFGDQPEAKGVFDLDSIQLIATVAKMNSGFLLSDHEMNKAPEFLIGAAANPFAPPFEMRIIRLYKKVEAGAHFIQTQPVFDLEIFTRWMERITYLGLHKKTAILAGVMAVKSAKTLILMQKKVPGVKIDKQYIERMKAASDPEEEGVKIALEIIKILKEIKGVRGIHLMPYLWESITPTIVREAGLSIIS